MIRFTCLFVGVLRTAGAELSPRQTLSLPLARHGYHEEDADIAVNYRGVPDYTSVIFVRKPGR